MVSNSPFTDWIDLKVQRRWYRIREELEEEIHSATDELRKEYTLSVHLNSATISSDNGRPVLRVPVSASWRDQLEQTIAYILVTSVDDDEPRRAAIAHGVEEALQRWIEREIPIGKAPVFLYPETEVRWPEIDTAQGKTVTEAPAPAEEPAEAPAASES